MPKKYTGTDSNCFACGIRNDHGLRLKFATFDDHVEAFFMPDRRYEGWDNIIHGGIISTLLDEAMSHAIFRLVGDSVVTAEMTVRFIRPLHPGTEVRLRGFIEHDRGKVIATKAEITNMSDELIAKARGRFVRVQVGDELKFC